MPGSKWSDDAFLNRLRQLGDELSDPCVEQLVAAGTPSDFAGLFQRMNSNDEPLPADMPPVLRDFFVATDPLPTPDGTPIDMARMKRGEDVFMLHAFPAALVLLVKSLPEGYSAPNLSKILCFTKNLRQHPFRRLLGVLQMLVNVSANGSLEGGGKSRVTAQKMRLLHSGIRHLVRTKMPDYEDFRARYQVPICLEDMLATIMGFSLLVVEGLQTLRVPLTPAEAEDYYYIWRVFSQLVGIYPPGQPNNSEFIPATLAEAREFYDTYKRRHFRSAAENPEGVELSQANLDMLNALLPRTPLRRLGMKIVPRFYMQELLGPQGFARTGVKPVRYLYLTRLFLRWLPRLWASFWEHGDHLLHTNTLHENLARIFFQRMITKTRGGEVTFLIPAEMDDLGKLV